MSILCSARNCQSNANTTLNGEQIKFFEFPSDQKFLAEWESICEKLPENKLEATRLLCELHFDKNSIESDGKLKQIAVPKKLQTKRSLNDNNVHRESPKKKFKDNIQIADIKNNQINNKLNDDLKPFKPYRLTIQISKVYLKPCPKSKKINQIKLIINNIHNSLNNNTENNVLKSCKNVSNAQRKNILQCSVCKQMFSDSMKLHIHIKKHLTCDICKTEFTSKGSFEKHSLVHRTSIKQFPYNCHICGLLFETKEAIRKHNHIILDTYDNKEECKVHYCKTCNITFRNETIYRKHLKTHMEKVSLAHLDEHSVTTIQSISQVGHLRPVIFSCRVCSQNFTSIAEIDQHTKNHMKEMEATQLV